MLHRFITDDCHFDVLPSQVQDRDQKYRFNLGQAPSTSSPESFDLQVIPTIRVVPS